MIERNRVRVTRLTTSFLLLAIIGSVAALPTWSFAIGADNPQIEEQASRDEGVAEGDACQTAPSTDQPSGDAALVDEDAAKQQGATLDDQCNESTPSLVSPDKPVESQEEDGPHSEPLSVGGGDTAEESPSPTTMDEFAAEHKGTIQPGTYVISFSCAPRRALDVASSSASDGANVQIYSSNMTTAQRWSIREEGDYLVFESVASGKVLDVKSGRAEAGTNVQQYRYNGTKAQKWVAVRNDDDTITLYSALGSNLVLDVSGRKDADKTNVDIYTANGTTAQRFSLFEANPKVPRLEQTLEDGTYILSAGSMCLDVKDARTESGTTLQMYSANDTVAQAFRIAYDEEMGFYTIEALNAGKLLDADKGDVVPGCAVTLWGDASAASHPLQRYWAFVSDESGNYKIVNAANGYALTARELSKGAPVIVDSGADTALGWSLAPSETFSAWSQIGMDEFAVAHANELPLGTYILSSALCVQSVVDVNGGSLSNSANVQLYATNNTNAQRWKIEDAGDGYVFICNVGSGKALDVSDGKATPKTNVQQYEKNATRAQKWLPVKQEDGTYVFYSALGRGLVLDVAGGSVANKTNVQVYTSNGTGAQRFDPITTTPNVQGQDRTVADGIYQISFEENENICMDVASASQANGAQVQSYASNGTLAQAFKVTYDSTNRCYSIRPAHSAKALDVTDGALVPGGGVQQWSYGEASKNQRWLIENDGDGSYRIRALVNGLYLDHGSGPKKPLTMRRASNTDAQRWRLSAFEPRIDEKTYTITSASINKVVDVRSGSTDEGAVVQVYALNKTFAQKWYVRKTDDGYYTVQNVGSAKYLAVADDGSAKQVSDAASTAAKWKVECVFGSGLALLNVSSGEALTVSDDGLKVAPMNESSAQAWKFSSVSLVDEGFYEFAPAHAASMRLDVADGSKSAGANVQIYKSNGTLSQRFWVRSAGSGWYTITACNSAMDLDVEDYGSTSGTNVQQWTRKSGNHAQMWRFEMGQHGIKVISYCGGNVLDVYGAGKSNRTNVDVYENNDTAAQGWRLIASSRPSKIGYQNPSNYPQVSSLTVKLPSYCTGKFTYVSPSRIAIDATRTDCVNAFVQRAYEYIGTQFIEPYSTAPGGAVDCSGLVLQCLYATGMDMGVYNPYNHRWVPSQTYNSMNWYNNKTFKPISTSKIQRGDVVYYRNHIAIYLGNNKIIDSWPRQGVSIKSLSNRGALIGAARPYV